METLEPSPFPDDGPYFDLEFDSSEESDFTCRTSSSSDDFLFLFGSPLPKPPTKFRLFLLRFKNRAKSENSKSVIRTCFTRIKLRFSGQLTPGGDHKAAAGGGMLTRQLSSAPAVERIRRRLRKCRSASAAVAAVTSPPPRRDDSLAQQEDGIESAIAHCKRSFNNSDRGSDSGLFRCRSDPGGERINQ